jgi:acyl carrier protein
MMSDDQKKQWQPPLHNRIATDMYDPEQVLKAIETQKQQRGLHDAEGTYVAPRSEVEQELVKIWAAVLGLQRVGVNDNFFKLGGNSIIAAQLLSRVRDSFQVELPLRLMFEMPTVAGLSISIVQSRAGQLDDQEMEQLLDELEELPNDFSSAAGEP